MASVAHCILDSPDPTEPRAEERGKRLETGRSIKRLCGKSQDETQA